MQTDADISRYNTCKKLAQLNKVVQYLSYHLDERIYQLETLRKRYETTLGEMFQEQKKKLAPLMGGLDQEREELEKSVKKAYESRLSTMQMALDHQKQATKDSIKKTQQSLQDEIQKGNEIVKNIIDELDKEFEFLNDRTKCDVSGIRIRIIQMNKDHKLALNTHDLEAKKKLAKLEEEHRKKIQELEKIHKAEMDKIKENGKIAQASNTQAAKSISNLKQKVSSIKKAIIAGKKEVQKHVSLSSTNISAFKSRNHTFIEKYEQQNSQYNEQKQNLTKELEEIQQAHKKELAESNNNLKNLKQKNENEITNLQNQLRMLKGNFKAELLKKAKSFESNSSAVIKDVSNFASKLMREFDELQKTYEKVREQKEKVISELKESIDDFNTYEQERLKDEQAQNKIDYTNHLDKFKNDFEEMLRQEIKRYKERKAELEKRIGESSSISAQYAKAEAERKKFQLLLDTQIKGLQTAEEGIGASLQDELRALKQKQTQEYEDEKAKNDLCYQNASNLSQTSIENHRNEIDAEYDKQRKKLDDAYAESMDKIQREFGEDDEKTRLESVFNQSLSALEANMNSITVPDTGVGENMSLTELKEKRQGIKPAIETEKDDLVSKYQQMLDDEENRYQSKLLSMLHNNVPDDLEEIRNSNKKKIEQLHDQVENLKNELHHEKMLSPSIHFLGDGLDSEQQRLQDLLCETRQDCKRKIRRSESAVSEMRKEFNSKIVETEEEARKQFDDFKKYEDDELAKYHDLNEEQRNRKKAMIENAQIKEREIIDLYNRKEIEICDNFNNVRSTIEQKMEHLQISSLTNKKQMELSLGEEKLQLEMLEMKYDSQLAEALKQLKERTQKSNPKLEDQLKEAQRYRDNAKTRFISKPMRSEERERIERLENTLAIKTKQLTTIGKDLLQYRQHLINQEGEYNTRFGVDPSVAIMRPNSKKRSTTSYVTKRLPKLVPNLVDNL